jgi:glycosyltransferase involved in cell wall biosynthesis
MPPPLSAYVPVYNNRSTLEAVLRSIQAQTRAVDELFVVDDGSSDGSGALAERMGVRVLRQTHNSGRGAARARAMLEARHELVLCCDATNVLDPNFVEQSMHWFEDDKVAAVFGRITQPASLSVADRWRGRHLFKVGTDLELRHNSPLITFGTIVRKSSALAVGNYNENLRQNEDTDLGERLREKGYDIVFDPNLILISIAHNTLVQVLERYSRWYGPDPNDLNWRGYFRQMAYAVKAMAKRDLLDRDPLSVPISLACPHVQYIRSYLESRRHRRSPNIGAHA